MNRFFTNVIDLITGNKARSTEVEANFSQIEAGFDALATEYDNTLSGLQTSKVAKAGDTYTGTHDMTGATLNVKTPAAGVPSSEAANMTALLNAIAAVNAIGMLARVPVDTATASALVGTVSEITYAGVSTIAMPVTTTDGVMVGFVTANGKDNVVQFGAQTLLGPFGELTGDVTLGFGNLYCRWNQSKSKWVSQ